VNLLPGHGDQLIEAIVMRRQAMIVRSAILVAAAGMFFAAQPAQSAVIVLLGEMIAKAKEDQAAMAPSPKYSRQFQAPKNVGSKLKSHRPTRRR
jgi:hypothetical protein